MAYIILDILFILLVCFDYAIATIQFAGAELAGKRRNDNVRGQQLRCHLCQILQAFDKWCVPCSGLFSIDVIARNKSNAFLIVWFLC